VSGLPTAKIIAVLHRSDAGPEGGDTCPHCGASGRYVLTFLCDDGVTRGAMSGCFQLFRRASGPVVALTRKACEKAAEARTSRRTLASWWEEILAATTRLGSGEITPNEHRALVLSADGRRREWLARKGYGQYRRAS